MNKKIKFVPPPANENIISVPTKLISITLPGVSTTLKHIPNIEPNIISENAIGIAYTPQQKTVSVVKDIDITKVSGKKSNAKKGVEKSPYSLPELKTIAQNLGINIKNKGKPQLAEEILNTIALLKSDDT
jgi:hypothetical protein